jgi:NPCBM/NEW2 domain/Zinc dependent phospholipase C
MKSKGLVAFLLLAAAARAWAWGEPHAYISQTAIDLLPAWQQPLLGDQVKPFVDRYCIYPDLAFKPDAKPYIMPSPAGVKALLHLPAGLEQNKLVFDYYLPRAIALFREGNTTEAMKYFGCVTHFIEDSSCPAHIDYGETAVPEGAQMLSQLDFIAHLMPMTGRTGMEWFHSRIDHCPFTQAALKAAVGRYKPRLLGASAEELIFNLVEQHYQMNQRAQRHLIPMLEALNANDMGNFKTQGLAAASEGTRLVADVFYTVLCVAKDRVETPLPREVSLADFTPATGSPFAWSDRNHQGRFIRNASGSWFASAGEFQSLGRQPLKLKLADGSARTFKKGFGVGWRSEYTFLVPPDVFTNFSVWAGNDAALGAGSTNTFEVLVNGRVAAATNKMPGLEKPAQRLQVPLAGASNLTLRVKSECPPSSTHGVWAEPTLAK